MITPKQIWRGIREGFSAFSLASYYRYNDYGCFWEELNIGYFQQYIYPYDDFYNAIISKERQLRLNQHPPDLSKYPWS